MIDAKLSVDASVHPNPPVAPFFPGDGAIQRGRIATLDVQRGIAILLICLVNVPGMGSTALTHLGNVGLSGWSPADRDAWRLIALFVSGTQRGMLQLLLGAGTVLLLSRDRQGTRSGRTIFIRRNVALALFGLADILLLGWYGDILLEYSLAALLAGAAWRLRARYLLALTACFLVYGIHSSLSGEHQTAPRSVETVVQGGRPLHTGSTLPRVTQASTRSDPEIAAFLAREYSAHRGGGIEYLVWADAFWWQVVLRHVFLGSVAESVLSILAGMALFKLGVIQGARSRAFYAGLAATAYGPGLFVRFVATGDIAAGASASPLIHALMEPARLAVAVGHVALINLLLVGVCRRVLLQFAPAGRTAFSLYLLQNAIFIWLLFDGTGFGLFGRYSWSGLAVIAIASFPLQLLAAHIWLSQFRYGPLEWLWRSATHGRMLSMRRGLNEPDIPSGDPMKY